jgi:tetratricopeptide (TPR) repeat protein
MIRLPLVVLLGLACAQEEFDPVRVNRWIVALSEDPTQEAVVGDLHGYLKKHDKLALVYGKFEESFDRRPKDAKLRYLLGRLFLRDGNRAGALRWFAAAAQADPDYAYTYLAQAELFQEQGDEKSLVVALEGVIQSSKEKPAVTGAIRKLAEHYARGRQLDRAASLWSLMAERYPDDAALLAESVKAVVAAGHLHRAVESLRAALALQKLAPSDRARFYLELATMERRVGRPGDAIQSLTSAVQAAVDDPELARKIDDAVLSFYREEDRLAELASQREKDLGNNTTSAVYIWRVARVRMAQDSLGQARDLLAAGLQKNPGNVLLLSALADVAALQGKHAEVRDLVRDLARREPARRDFRRREGEACLELGQVDEAEAAFRAYALRAPEFVDVARIYERRTRLTDAAVYYRRAIELKPDPGWSRALVGLLVRLDRLSEAEQEAVRCTPGDRERWALLRDLLVERGETAKACHYAKKDVEANPKDFQARLLLGRLQARVVPADAEATFRKALEIAEQGQRGQVYEELAALAPVIGPVAVVQLEAELKQLIEAFPNDGGYCYALYRLAPRGLVLISILEQGRKNDPKHARLRQELAPYYANQKQYDVAIDVYRELIEIDPARRDLYVHAVGEIYWALGHKDQAFSWWAKVQGSGKDKIGISFQLAKKYEAEKRYVQAIELLQQIVKEEPDGVVYHWALAQLYRQLNAVEGIVREFKWILAYSRDEGHLRIARQVLADKLSEHARSLLDQQEFARALEELTEALRYAPDEPATGGIVAQIARTSEHLRDYAKAADHYHRLLSRYSGVAVIASGGRTMNAALFASLQLRGNPECLKAYEDLVGPASKGLLEESLQKGDRAGMERLLETYPLSTAAGIAAFWLGESYRKENAPARAAALYERLLAELSLAAIDEPVVRMRLVEVAALLKDWGTVQTQLGELFARAKDRTPTIDGKPVAMKDFLKHWQKELGSNAVGLGVSWGLPGRDSKNSSFSPQELAPPLVQKWRYQAMNPSALMGFPSVSAAGGLVYLNKEDILVALDAVTGSVRWTAPLRGARVRARQVMFNGMNGGLEGRYAVSQGVVGGIDGDQEIRVFDAATGAGLWTRISDVPRLDGGVVARGGRVKATRRSWRPSTWRS